MPTARYYTTEIADVELPTTNNFLARLYTIRDEAAARAKREAGALVARHSAKGMLRSGATLEALAVMIEKEFEGGLNETLDVLRHMKSVPGADYATCPDQAFLRARDLVPSLRGATDLDKWLGMIGHGSAADVINGRIDALFGKIEYRFRQSDVGLGQRAAKEAAIMTPTATRLQQRTPIAAHGSRTNGSPNASHRRQSAGGNRPVRRPPCALRRHRLLRQFSRLEYALKEARILKNPEPGANAEPGWTRFIEERKDRYLIGPAGKSLIAANPQRQIVTAVDLDCREVDFNPGASDLERVVRLAQTVRNNLFHGGKHGSAY